MLSFDQVRFVILLLMTFDFIIVVHAVNFIRGKKTDGAEEAKFLVPLLLLMSNIIIFTGTIGASGSIDLSPSSSQFITSIQSSVAFAFIFSLVSIFFLLWYYSGTKNPQFMSGSLLLSHLSLLLLAISLVTGLVSPSIVPTSVQDYSGLAITSVVGIVFTIIERKGST